MRKLRKYLALTPPGRAIVLRSLFLLPVVAVLLRSRGLWHTRAWLACLGPFAAGDATALVPSEIAKLVAASASTLHIPCLPRSLVLWHFLRDRGGSAEIRLGVAKLDDGRLSAHAWVEFDGLPLNENLDLFERYAVLPMPAGRLRPSLLNTFSL